MNKKNVLVVGGTQGIGLAVAHEYARGGCDVAIVGRNPTDLVDAAEALRAHGGKVVAIACDALDPAAAAACVAETVSEAGLGHIDIALMNVGGATPLSSVSASADEILRVMAVNYATLVHFFVPVTAHMRARGGGVFAHTNSIAGHAGMPLSAHYSASKAAGRVFLEGARVELREHNVRVVTLCPGFVQTRSHEKGEVPTPFILSPQAAAKKMVRAIERERREVSFPWQLATASWVGRVMPRALVDVILARSTPKLPTGG
jgi:short-subunit dehydrogenase